MKEYKMRTFTYKCSCGHVTSVFVDCGTPQETITCRMCKKALNRE